MHLESNSGILLVTGIIIAGGQSRRLGKDKALLSIQGQPLLNRISDRVTAVCEELIVVGPPERQQLLPEALVVQDIHPNAGPIAGLQVGLRNASHLWSIVVACDMPFLNPNLLQYLISLGDGYDIVLPRYGGYTHQLCAAYSKNCLAHIESQIAEGDYKIDRFFSDVRVRYVDEPDLQQYDPGLQTFLNVNTPEALAKVEDILARAEKE